MNVLGIVFDLDGVIVDTAEFHYIAWKNLGNKLGIEIDRDFNEKLKGVSRMDSLDKILEAKGLKEAMPIEEKEALAKEKNDEYVKLIDTIKPSDMLPGVKEFLESLKRSGIKIGLASASKNALPVLKRLDAEKYFDYVADPNLCKKNKPAPDIFLLAAKGLGLRPENCIGVEDAKAGIEGINSAGMFSIGIGDKKMLREADLILSSTRELSLNLLNNR
jgi:beta-phosphoglucomutase